MADIDQATLDDDTNSEPEQTMDDTIAATWAEIQARGEDSEEEQPVQETLSRDDKGQFKQKAEDKPVDAEQTDQQATQQTDAQQGQVPGWMQMGLRKEEAEAVARAPKEAQAAFERRMRESQEGLKRMHEQLGPKAQQADVFEQAIAPFRQTMAQLGVEPHIAVQNVLAAEHGLRYGNDQQRATHALQLLNSYGINLNAMYAIATGNQAPAQQQVAVPQATAPAQDFNQAVNQAVESRFAQQEIAQFESEGHAHFEELKPLMSSLLMNGAANGIRDAYDQALRAHPVHGSQWLAEQQAAQEAQRKAEAQKKAQEARRAAGPNVAKRGTLPSAKPVGTMDDTIRDAAMRLGLIQ